MRTSLGLLFVLFAVGAQADNIVHPGTPTFDRPTLTALGVQLPVTGDDNFNATVTVRYRPTGAATWRQALPLHRVHPENTALWTVAPQFAGSVFDLRPNTSYDVELQLTDPDGPLNQTFTLTGATRPVPSDPPAPRLVNVSTVAALNSALAAAQPGDVITLADGVYNVGTISFSASGTVQNPIVIRGASEEGTVLDGANCSACNVVEIYGSYVHLERMTLQNAQRALRFQTAGATGNVVRYVHIKNTILGIAGRQNQTDFYLCDNTAEGRLAWPLVYGSDGAAHSDDDGLVVGGFGHVVCHNRISGFADALQINQSGSRAIDFYGNEVLWTYDDGVELDGSEGNVRAFRNRFTNTFDTISLQPIRGGPAYVFRNIVVNVAGEQMKFHALGTIPPQEPNGILAYHNTFVAPDSDIYMGSPNSSHHFRVENNLFVGPATLPGYAVEWDGPIDDGLFDYNGYFSDGVFSFNFQGIGYRNFPDFLGMQSGGMETHGVLLTQSIFASDLTAPPSYTVQVPPQNAALSATSNALDRGLVLPNINDGFTGLAPDLGAVEAGCPAPIYGPRPPGVDESNEPFGCDPSSLLALSSVSVSPSSIVSGQPATGTATLTLPAGFGGAIVSLFSSNPAAASVPTSVTVAQGNTSATFPVQSGAVSSPTPVTLTGTYLGIGKTALLTVNPQPPAALASLSVNPTSVSGGSPATGTVTLTAPAPVNGAVVSLSSSNADAQVPASVTVPQGSTSATFAITTASVKHNTTITLKVTYQGLSKSASLTLTATKRH